MRLILLMYSNYDDWSILGLFHVPDDYQDEQFSEWLRTEKHPTFEWTEKLKLVKTSADRSVVDKWREAAIKAWLLERNIQRDDMDYIKLHYFTVVRKFDELEFEQG